MSVLDKIKKRRFYPVDLGDGNIVNCRALTIGELRRLEALDKELKTPFVMGVALVDDKGATEFTKTGEESDVQFAERVREAIADVSTETISAISQAIGKIGKVPEVETVKN